MGTARSNICELKRVNSRYTVVLVVLRLYCDKKIIDFWCLLKTIENTKSGANPKENIAP